MFPLGGKYYAYITLSSFGISMKVVGIIDFRLKEVQLSKVGIENNFSEKFFLRNGEK
jgi:hypothetical protein